MCYHCQESIQRVSIPWHSVSKMRQWVVLYGNVWFVSSTQNLKQYYNLLRSIPTCLEYSDIRATTCRTIVVHVYLSIYVSCGVTDNLSLFICHAGAQTLIVVVGCVLISVCISEIRNFKSYVWGAKCFVIFSFAVYHYTSSPSRFGLQMHLAWGNNSLQKCTDSVFVCWSSICKLCSVCRFLCFVLKIQCHSALNFSS